MNRRVDQKLHLAKVALASSEGNTATEIALVEAALFHLNVAYRAYLHEILTHFKLTVTVDSALQAAQQLRERNLHCADVNELIELEQNGEWLAQMRAAYSAAAQVDMVPVPPTNGAIALHDVTAQIDRSVCVSWLRHFHALLQRQREHAQEW